MLNTSAVETEQKFIVSILCKGGFGFAQYMGSGIRTSGKTRNFLPTRDQRKAAQFSKSIAETLVVDLKNGWGLTGQVEEAQLTVLAPYTR